VLADDVAGAYGEQRGAAGRVFFGLMRLQKIDASANRELNATHTI
jgi:hypothetical protein